MTKEKALTKNIQRILGEHNYLCFDVNVGKFALKNGGYVDVGLPKGFSDLLIFSPDGKTIFLEAKIKPNKPSPEQVNFIKNMRCRGFYADVIYSVEDLYVLLNGSFHTYLNIL